MASARRGMQNIRTISALLDGRRVRSSAGALMELSALANERERLNAELERWVHRHAEIQARLAEIAAKEKRLQHYVQLNGEGGASRPLPRAETPKHVVTRELNY